MIITESGAFRKGHHGNGHRQLTEAARFVSVANLRDRTLLWAGYHRAYAYNHYAGHAPATVKLFWDIWSKKKQG